MGRGRGVVHQMADSRRPGRAARLPAGVDGGGALERDDDVGQLEIARVRDRARVEHEPARAQAVGELAVVAEVAGVGGDLVAKTALTP